MKVNKLFLAISIGITLFIAGCGNSPESEIYNHLEEAVKLEEGFQEQQDDITKLEQKEQELYKEIIELGIDELDKIKELADQALISIEERKEKISLEKESLDASRKEFENSKEYIEKVEDKEAKEKALAMYETMEKRYDAYDKLHAAYNDSLTLEKELYAMLQRDELEQEELQQHIESINLKYQEVIEANEAFNTFTTEYNTLKKGFYELANIDVKYNTEK
ncbi:YkyA family protein [Ornithinibacillus scapharcae]|uniref:YkyA family protein n=1 Tax=Ornithinibacillus scapharcae TaxID=1147159 RepID=UPI000225BA90|nr:YkyA family protein [Ornithinibacillus scapharcae]